MRKLLALLPILVAVLFISCSAGPSGDSSLADEPVILDGPLDIDEIIPESSGDRTTVSRPIIVEDGSQPVILTGLECGKLYTIYTGRAGNAKAIASTGEDITINDLGEGTYAFILPEGVTEIEFKASEIGIGSGGEFRIGAVAAPRIDFTDGSKGMTIGQGATDPIFINQDGSEEYEAFYRIDMAAVENPENVVVTAITSNTGSASMSHWFRFIDESGAEIEGINGNAVIDLSGYDTVYLYANLIVRSSANDDARFHVYFRNPVLIGDKTVKLEPSQTYLIDPAPASLLAVENDGGGLGAFANSLNARYAGSGKHFSNVFPVRITDSRIEINIPEHSEPIMFDYSGRELSARLEPVPAGFAIESMGKGERAFSVSEGTAIFPVIFTVLSPGGMITLESGGGSGRLGLRHESGNGYATETLGPGQPYTVADSRYLEYFFFRNDTGEECSFTLTVQ